MAPATTPEALLSFAERLRNHGGAGLLVSGGCDGVGVVPLTPYLPALRKIRTEMGLKLNMHVGLCDGGFAERLRRIEPEAVSVELVGKDAAVREVFGLKCNAEEYWAAYSSLLGAGLNAVPHLTIGLHGGAESGEEDVIERLASFSPKRLVLNALVPTRGTRCQEVEFDCLRALRLVRLARERLPRTALVLGCMRPRGHTDFEFNCMRLGVAGIVNPSRALLGLLKDVGYNIEVRESCCALG
jgi:hypothetical protein